MGTDRITEFLTVLIFALTVGIGIWLVMSYLEGAAQGIGLAVVIAATITAWQYLRKRFGRFR